MLLFFFFFFHSFTLLFLGVILLIFVTIFLGCDQKDSLMEISFHIPNSNTQFVGDENRPPAQVSSVFLLC